MISMFMKALSIALLSILLGAGYQVFRYMKAKHEMNDILSGLKTLELAIPRRDKPALVAVGIGGCMDVFIDAVPFLTKMNFTPTEGNVPPEQLNNYSELEKSFAYHFKEGIAAERYLNNITQFKGIVKALKQSNAARWELGGNAPVMGNRLAKEGCKVLLGSNTNQEMLKHFHKNMTSIAGSMKSEDVHVIMEYKVGDQWGSLKSPRANRYIVHGDQNNPYLRSLEEFEKNLGTLKPDLLVIGGLQMMDNFPFEKGARQKRLQKLEAMLQRVPSTTRVHFEMASFVEPDLMDQIVKSVVPYADSLGMNEQELPNLQSMVVNGRITLSATAYPRAAVMLDQVRHVFKALENQSETKGHRRLSRLHLHTIGYQVVAVRHDGRFEWPYSRAAAAKASLTANRHTCGKNEIDIQRSKILVDDSFAISAETRNSPRVLFNRTEPVSCWREGALEFCVAPVLVCTQVRQTAGGGDNISAATLAVQI